MTLDDLIKPAKQSYEGNYEQDLLKIYEMYVESADRISNRRHQANTLFLSINTLLIAASAEWLAADGSMFVWIAALAGFLFCLSWHTLINQYRSLNTAKFQVIHRIEKDLLAAPLTIEWALLEQGKNPKGHQPLTKIEAMVPLIFGGIHSLVFVISLYSRGGFGV